MEPIWDPWADPEPFIRQKDIDNSVIEKILRNEFHSTPVVHQPVKIPWNEWFADCFSGGESVIGIRTDHGDIFQDHRQNRYVPGLVRPLPLHPQLSTLTIPQHHQCLRVLNPKGSQSYGLQPPSHKDYAAYKELKEAYEKEQKEYIKWAKVQWANGDCIRALRPSPVLEAVYLAEFTMRAAAVASLPAEYSLAAQIPLRTTGHVCDMELKTELLKVDVLDLPIVEYPEVLHSPLRVLKQCPMPAPCERHPCKFVLPTEDSVSMLPLSDIHRELAEYSADNDAQFIASENALRCLVETQRSWKLPVTVIQVLCPDGDARNIVVLGSEFSVRMDFAPHRACRAYTHLLRHAFTSKIGQYKINRLKKPLKPKAKASNKNKDTLMAKETTIVTKETNIAKADIIKDTTSVSATFMSVDDDLAVSSDDDDERLLIDDTAADDCDNRSTGEATPIEPNGIEPKSISSNLSATEQNPIKNISTVNDPLSPSKIRIISSVMTSPPKPCLKKTSNSAAKSVRKLSFTDSNEPENVTSQPRLRKLSFCDPLVTEPVRTKKMSVSETDSDTSSNQQRVMQGTVFEFGKNNASSNDPRKIDYPFITEPAKKYTFGDPNTSTPIPRKLSIRDPVTSEPVKNIVDTRDELIASNITGQDIASEPLVPKTNVESNTMSTGETPVSETKESGPLKLNITDFFGLGKSSPDKLTCSDSSAGSSARSSPEKPFFGFSNEDCIRRGVRRLSYNRAETEQDNEINESQTNTTKSSVSGSEKFNLNYKHLIMKLERNRLPRATKNANNLKNPVMMARDFNEQIKNKNEKNTSLLISRQHSLSESDVGRDCKPTPYVSLEPISKDIVENCLISKEKASPCNKLKLPVTTATRNLRSRSKLTADNQPAMKSELSPNIRNSNKEPGVDKIDITKVKSSANINTVLTHSQTKKEMGDRRHSAPAMDEINKQPGFVCSGSTKETRSSTVEESNTEMNEISERTKRYMHRSTSTCSNAESMDHSDTGTKTCTKKSPRKMRSTNNRDIEHSESEPDRSGNRLKSRIKRSESNISQGNTGNKVTSIDKSVTILGQSNVKEEVDHVEYTIEIELKSENEQSANSESEGNVDEDVKTNVTKIRKTATGVSEPNVTGVSEPNVTGVSEPNVTGVSEPNVTDIDVTNVSEINIAQKDTNETNEVNSTETNHDLSEGIESDKNKTNNVQTRIHSLFSDSESSDDEAFLIALNAETNATSKESTKLLTNKIDMSASDTENLHINNIESNKTDRTKLKETYENKTDQSTVDKNITDQSKNQLTTRSLSDDETRSIEPKKMRTRLESVHSDSSGIDNSEDDTLDVSTLSEEAVNDIIGVTNCTCKDSVFEVPPPRSFKKWQLTDRMTYETFDVIIHTSHKVRHGGQEVLLEPIVEYQPDKGGVRQPTERVRSLALALMLRGAAKLLNVRVEHAKGDVIDMESVSGAQLAAQHGDMSRDVADALHATLAQLRHLLPGDYVLDHDLRHGHNAMLYTTKRVRVPTAGAAHTLSLHRDNIAVNDSEETNYVKIAPELDTVLLPYHKSRKILPCAFTPYQNQVREDKKKLAPKSKHPPQAIQDGASTPGTTQWPKKKKKKKARRDAVRQ